ncbi:uncharacterized protein BX664DRAFT_385285 [Halteromyces radiatus]|uniref:uncharacterized protein n=1 Tax=Halteromyces radiatus TaxID=101107 RepID=UPI00221E783F|nr:uncharacterized protein BX664DRAFT_385285 [Halteromyces radiatus]KAI8088666.1 hypothetical protein BX664DRAFT_385285 [Halteromyces radiatus]
MSTQRVTKKRRRQCETCINCRSSRKQCDKGYPCRNCADNNRKCLYAKEFPYSNLSQEQQAAILERLLYEAKGKYDLLKKYMNKTEDWKSQVVLANNKRHLVRNIRMEADMYDSLRQQTAARLVKITVPGEPEWQLQDGVYQSVFQRNSRLITLTSNLYKETVPPLPRSLDTSELFSIDIARAMVSVEEVDMLIALYNDCYSFSSLPEFITPHLDDNGDYDLLLSSVMTLMLSHAVNLHSMKVDNHQQLSHAFYHYTRDLLSKRMTALQQQPDIMCLHTTFNLMLYEAENGYLDEATLSRQSMSVMIDSLHKQYSTMSVWQQSLLRHLFWAIFTADASRHNLQMQTHVICSSYMQVDKQRPSEHCAQPVDRLKEEYIYYRCRLADIIRHIDDICYKRTPSSSSSSSSSPSSTPPSTSSSSSSSSASSSSPTQTPSPSSDTSSGNGIRGQDIKLLENELWDLYHELPTWVTDGQPLESVQLSKYDGYFGHPATRPSVDPCVHSRAHPVCKRTLDEVWIRRLRYHFLVEWHGTFLYLYQIFLPQPGEIIQLPFMRCFEHGQLMVDVLTKWADDPDFFDCYCYPALRSILVASHIHRYLLQSEFDDIRNKGYELLFKLFSVIQRSNIYNLYKDTAFILNIKDAFDRIRRDYLLAQRNAPVPSPVINLDQFNHQGNFFGSNLDNDDDDLYVYTATAS